ncbi:MAG: hypothetical protein PWQ06_1494, partial [Anaerophaga sp.]|nr:hypothetical protein [Anaerophaga sp.]
MIWKEKLVMLNLLMHKIIIQIEGQTNHN